MAANDLFSFSSLKLQVGENVGDQSDLTLEQAGKWINRALLMFSEVGEWSWQRLYNQSVNTMAGTATVELAGVLRVESIYTQTPLQRKLTLIEDRLFRIRFPNATATGTPYYWRIAGRKRADTDTQIIGLYPIPDSIYTLNYDCVKPITLLVDDTDDIRTDTGMPSVYVNLVVELATALGMKADDDVKAKEQLEECVVRLESFYQKDQNQIDDRLITRPQESEDLNRFFDPVLPPNFDGL